MGRLIVLEGIDGSGKGTQLRLLCRALESEGVPFRTLDFPRYGNRSCALAEAYLQGAFGSRPGDVNAYTAATFFAVDRAASFLEDWGDWWRSGGLLVANRYTTSNVIHQGSKLPEGEREAFFRWLYDFEFSKLGLQKPDIVLYLDVPLEIAEAQRRRREAETNTSADIHEADRSYLASCRACGLHAAELLGWRRVDCARDGSMRSVEDIHREIAGIVRTALNA